MRHILRHAPISLALLGASAPAAAQSAPAGSPQWHQAQRAALAGLAAQDGWYILDGGVRFRRIAGNGSGSAPPLDYTIRVNYTGRFADGSVFDSNAGRPPAQFPLAGLIRGWQIALPYAGVGDTVEIAVPMELAYGPDGRGPIPGGATLFFTIELLAVIPPAS